MGLNTEYNSAAYKPYVVDGKHNLEGIDLSNCINVAEIGQLLKDPSNSSLFNPTQSRLIGAFNVLGKNGDLGKLLNKFAIEENSILCDMSVRPLEGTSAYYETEDHFIALETLDKKGNIKSESSLGPTVLEEFGHQYQDIKMNSIDNIRDGNYLSKHKVLAHMAIEAQAKLSIAREAFKGAMGSGNPDLLVEVVNSGSVIGKMTKNFLANGLDSINDPNVLMKNFNEFFNDKVQIDAYMKHFMAEATEFTNGSNTIPSSTFVENYGFAIGSDVNFMSGKNIDASYLERLIEETSPEAFAAYSKIGKDNSITTESEPKDTPTFNGP